MKKLMFIGVLLAMLLMVLLPAVTSAGTNCCDFPCDSCCQAACCAEETRWYSVSFFDVDHVWTTEYVETHDSEEAAELFGLDAGHNCFVRRAIFYRG